MAAAHHTEPPTTTPPADLPQHGVQHTAPAPAHCGPPHPTAGPHAGYLAELASHGALGATAAQIGAAIGTHLPAGATVCLIDDPDLAAASWTDIQLDSALQRYAHHLSTARTALADQAPAHLSRGGDDLQPAAVPSAPSMPIAALGALAEVIGGLTVVEATVTTRSVTAQPAALTNALGHALTAHPHVKAIIVEPFHLITADNPVVARLATLYRSRDELADLARSTAPHGDLTDRTDVGNPHTAAGRGTHSLTAAPTTGPIAQIQRLLSQLDMFLHAITTAGTGRRPAALTAALRAARTADGDTPTHLLHAQIDSIGADVINRKWLWHNAITFVGGAAVSYRLLDIHTGYTYTGSHAATATFRYRPWRNRISSLTTCTVPRPAI